MFLILMVCCYVCYSLVLLVSVVFLFFFKQKTAYEMRISDWSSDVCSSDLLVSRQARGDLLLKQGYRGAALTRTEPREHIGIGEIRTQSLAADEQTRQRAVGRSVTSPRRPHQILRGEQDRKSTRLNSSH